MMMMMMIIIIIIIIEDKDHRNMRDELIDTEVHHSRTPL